MSEYKPYSKQKSEYDNKVMLYVMKRLMDDETDSDAYNEGIFDEVGNRLKPDGTAPWAFTELDRLVTWIKHNIGKKKIDEMLGSYSFVKNIDPLVVLNWNGHENIHNKSLGYDRLISMFEDADYLPDGLKHSESYVEDSDVYSKQERTSQVLTVLSYMLMVLRTGSTPSSIDFKHNVLKGVEVTFNHRGWDDYEWCKLQSNERKLVENNGLSRDGMRFLVASAKVIKDFALLADTSIVENNQSVNWRRLAKL